MVGKKLQRDDVKQTLQTVDSLRYTNDSVVSREVVVVSVADYDRLYDGS